MGIIFDPRGGYRLDVPTVPFASVEEATALPEELLEIDRKAGDLAECVIEAVRVRLRNFGNDPDLKFFDGMEEIAKAIQAMAEGDRLLGRDFWLSSLPCGAGKTVTMSEAVAQLIHRPEYAHVGVIVFMSQVDQIKDALNAMQLDPSEYAVIVSKSYRGKFDTLGTDPDKARVIFSTQQMLQSCLKGHQTFAAVSQFHYRGEARRVRIWDEAIVPSTIHTLGVYELSRLHGYIVRADKIRGEALVKALEAFSSSQLREAKPGTVVSMPDVDSFGIELDKVLAKVRSDDDQQAIRSLWYLASRRTARIQSDQFGNAILGYEDIFPIDMGPMLVLDASGQHRQVYADWYGDRRGLRALYSPQKDYSGLTIYHWNKGAGRGQFYADNLERFGIYDAVRTMLSQIPDSARVFLLTHKPEDKPANPSPKWSGVANIEAELTASAPSARSAKWLHLRQANCDQQLRRLPARTCTGALAVSALAS